VNYGGSVPRRVFTDVEMDRAAAASRQHERARQSATLFDRTARSPAPDRGTIRVAPVPARLRHGSAHYLLAPVLMMMAAPPLCLRPN
jgi:hypothetical protein